MRPESGLRPGQFVPGDSLLHQLDPRTKILGSLVVIFSALLDFHWDVLLLGIVFMAAAVACSGIGAAEIFRVLARFRYLFLLSFAGQALLTRGHPLLRLGLLSVTGEGIALGVSTILRLGLLFLGSCLLTMTTSPLKLAAGMESLLAPLARLRLPVHQLALLVSTALRFVPTVMEEGRTLARAQQSRGASLDSRNLVVRSRSMLAILIPLLAASLQRAGDLAVAMECRCYTGGANQTRIEGLAWGRKDVLALGLIFAVLALSVVLM